MEFGLEKMFSMMVSAWALKRRRERGDAVRRFQRVSRPGRWAMIWRRFFSGMCSMFGRVSGSSFDDGSGEGLGGDSGLGFNLRRLMRSDMVRWSN